MAIPAKFYPKLKKRKRMGSRSSHHSFVIHHVLLGAVCFQQTSPTLSLHLQTHANTLSHPCLAPPVTPRSRLFVSLRYLLYPLLPLDQARLVSPDLTQAPHRYNYETILPPLFTLHLWVCASTGQECTFPSNIHPLLSSSNTLSFAWRLATKARI